MKHPLQAEYDVVVCGAGPAGLVCALEIIKAKPNLSVALLDKRDPWREPVSCAEAVSNRGLHNLVEVDPTWIRGAIDGVEFVSPSGTRVEYSQPQSGLLIDRAKLHRGLAERCAAQGVHCNFRSEVKGIAPSESPSGKWEVEISGTEAESTTVLCRALVDASGAGGRLTRGVLPQGEIEDGRFDLEPAVFALIEGLPHRANYIEMFFGQTFFPGGYGWLFPRDGHTANVGLVLGKEFVSSKPPRKMLAQWVQTQWPGAKIGQVHGGAIACGQSEKAIASRGIFKAGDSASQVNPISRAGILEAMKGGRLVAHAVCSWLPATAPERASIEAQLQHDWMILQGEGHRRLAIAKKAFGSIPDTVFDKAAARIVRIPPQKRTLFRIFWHTLLAQPILLWRMRSLLK